MGTPGAAVSAVAIALLAGATGCELIFGLHDPPAGTADATGADAFTADAGPDAFPPDALPALACPPDYVDLGTGWYRLVPGPAMWPYAAADCANDSSAVATYTHLVVIGSPDEMARLVETAFAAPSSTWLGLSDRVDEGTFRWVTFEDTSAFTMLPWLPMQPDNGGGNPQHCVRWGGGFDDDFGTTPYPYVCECDRFVNQPSQY